MADEILRPHMRPEGERERYTKLNAEFQQKARRDKKAFLCEHCKETEKSNRVGKTRELFEKTRDTMGTFHAKMRSVKDKNGKELTEAEEIKKRWQEYTKELYKAGLNDPGNHGAVGHSPRARHPGV